MPELMRYTTVRSAADAEFEEKRSLFIGHIRPVEHEEEALAFLAEMRTAYADATHNVYAYVLRENSLSRYSDDREPQGTAGLPVLDVLRKANVTDAAIVVTRYFGGTLLGTGGLVRAYTQAARMALEAGGIVTRARLAILQLAMNYSDYQKIIPLVENAGARVDDSTFAGDVRLSVALPFEEAEEFLHRASEITGGRVACCGRSERFDFL